jgi:flagellin
MTVINTNVKALFTQSALKLAARDSQIAMEQLSTGKRINNSKDDAAGLAIAARMTQNIQGLNQSIRNAGDAISMIQTAEGATQEITVMLQRMSELAVQAANSTYSSDQRSYLDQEFQQLKQEIIRVSEMHEWNGFPILNGKAGTPVGTPTTSTIVRAGVTSTGSGKALEAGDLELQTANGSFAIPASIAAADPKSNTIASGSTNAGSAIAIAAAINSQVGVTGVSAVAGAATIGATKTTVGTTSIQTDLYVNGEKVSLSLSASHTLSQRRQYVMESINAGTAVHGVVAGDSGTGGLTLTTPDGRNLSVWYDSTSVQGSDFGLGLDTTPPSNPLGVTGVSGSTASAFGANETSTITFPALAAGRGFTLNGLTFIAGSSGTSDVETAAAFSNLKSGMSALAAAASNPNAVTKGSFSGTFAEGFTTGTNNSTNQITATAISKGNVGNIVTSDSIPTIVKTDGATSTEYVDVTFPTLTQNQTFTLAGVTVTAGALGVSAANLAAAFAGKAAGATISAGNASAGNDYTVTNGSTTLTAYSTGAATGSVVRFTSSTASTNVTDLAATGTNANLVSIGTISQGATGTETNVITFKALNPNDFVTVNGLTFTARVNMTANEVAAAFSNIASGATSAAVTLANPIAANFGKFSGTFTAGFSTGPSTSSGTVTATSTVANTNVTDLTVSGVLPHAAINTVAGSTVAASTVYGTVTLNSQNTFTVKPGAKAYASANAPAADPTYANFTALGFEAKTINAKNIGRLNFQVGPAANQLISIDLADFGKNGDITGPITSDRAPTNLLTVNSANDVIMNVNKSLDRIAATRATMGAVMNRLEHVIDNLTNVVMNSEASRSQIEDADYAKASTELARTQIMQQAATAVLAQANTSQQTVLKLLQG